MTAWSPRPAWTRSPGSSSPPGSFGPDRATLLKAQLPATDADAAERCEAQAAALKSRIRQIDIAQDSKILELEQLPADPADTASAAMRARIRALLDQLPLAGDTCRPAARAEGPPVRRVRR
jgi:hypothetical protein